MRRGTRRMVERLAAAILIVVCGSVILRERKGTHPATPPEITQEREHGGAPPALEPLDASVERSKRTLSAEEIDSKLRELDEQESRDSLIERANRGELNAEGRDALRRYLRSRHALLIAKYEKEE